MNRKDRLDRIDWIDALGRRDWYRKDRNGYRADRIERIGGIVYNRIEQSRTG